MTIQVTDDQLQAVVSKMVQSVIDMLKPASQVTEEKMLSTKEVAGLLSVSARTVIAYTKRKKLTSYRLVGSVRYKRSEVLNSWEAIDHGR